MSDQRNALDTQVGGGHYKDFKIQPVEFIHANNVPFIEGNIIKYILRHRQKNGLQDLEKVKHYVDLLIEMEYADKVPSREDLEYPQPAVAKDGAKRIKNMLELLVMAGKAFRRADGTAPIGDLYREIYATKFEYHAEIETEVGLVNVVPGEYIAMNPDGSVVLRVPWREFEMSYSPIPRETTMETR